MYARWQHPGPGSQRLPNSRDIDAAFEEIARENLDAAFVEQSPFFSSRRVQLASAESDYWALTEHSTAVIYLFYTPHILDLV